MYESDALNRFVALLSSAGFDVDHVRLANGWEGPSVVARGEIDGFDERNVVVEHCDVAMVRDGLGDNRFRFRPAESGAFLGTEDASAPLQPA